MAKRAWCGGCNCYVVLSPEGLCPQGHPRPLLRAVEEVPDNVASPPPPAPAAPGASVAVPSSADAGTGYAPAGSFAGDAGWTEGVSLGPPPAPRADPTSEFSLPPGADEMPKSSDKARNLLALGIVVGLVCFAGITVLVLPPVGLPVAMLVAQVLLSAATLWVGMRATGVEGTFLALLIISGVCAVLGFLPLIGWVVGLIVMFALITRWTSASLWPDAILMVIVAQGVAWLGAFWVLGTLLRPYLSG